MCCQLSDPSTPGKTCACSDNNSSPFHASDSDKVTLVVVDLASPITNQQKEQQDYVARKAFQNEQSQQDNRQLLKTLSSHLNLLTAGSLFLLPSVLPFLASVLTSYASTLASPPSPQSFLLPTLAISANLSNSLNSDITTSADNNSSNWQTCWVLLLPCVGVVAPLSLFKAMTMLEEISFQCPFRRWRQNRRRIVLDKSGVDSQKSPISGRCHCAVVPAAAVVNNTGRSSATRAMKRRQKYEQHGIMFGPTVQAIKRAWKVLKSEPSGYGPLALGSPVSESFSDGEDDSVYESTLLNMENNNTPFVDLMQQDAPCIKCISDHDKNSSVRPQFSVLPRPRSILLASLGAWTILMALSSIFGFNSVQISGEKTFPAPFYNDMSENSSGIDLQSWEPMSMGNVRQGGIIVIEESGSNGDMDNELDFLNTVTSMLEKGLANSEEADRRIDEEPFATIKSSIVIVNKQSQDETKPALPVPELNQVEQEDVDMDQDDIIDFSEPDSLDALIMDPEDAYLFHNFLEHLEFEDQEAKALEESTLEAQRQKQLEVIKATDDLVITSMLDNDLPCGAQASIADLTPNWVKGLSNLTQFGENHRRGQIFKYLPGWTELMILTVTMCLGSLLVGLGQAKMLHYQLSLQQQQQQPHVSESNKHMSIATILSCLAVSGSALGLTLLMIFSECWDVPSVYFVGIGIAGMILVHAWVPDMALQVEYIDDFVQDGYQLVYDEEAQFGINDEKSFVTDRRNAFEERL